MVSQDFKTDELKAALERSLGFELRPLMRLGGSVAVNFKAERMADGLGFIVKCLPKSKRRNYDNIVTRLDLLSDVVGMRRIFAQECPESFEEYELLCLSRCDGKHMFTDRMTDGQLVNFLDDYRSFSEKMQKAANVEAPRPIAAYREDVLAKCRGPFGGMLRHRIESLSVDDWNYRSELLRVTHGDFHHGNVMMARGRVSGFLDLEEFRLGYPADDLVRYFTCAAEHLRWYEQSRKRGMLKKFALAVHHLPYSRHEWMMAVNARFILKAYKQLRHEKCAHIGNVFNLCWCFSFYRVLRDVVQSVKREGGA